MELNPAVEPREFVAADTRERVNVLRAMDISGKSKRTIYNWIDWGWVDSVATPYGRMIYLDSLLRRLQRDA